MTATRPDHASPWVLDTRKLGRRAGAAQRVQLSVPTADRIGIDLIGVPAGGEVALDLQFESVTEGVWVSGTASAVAEGQCSRCLTDLNQPVAAGLHDLYVYPGSTTDQTTDVDELPRIADDMIDLLPLVRDEIVLALPLAPVCRPDCPGLCPECGERLDDLEPGHRHEILDPRWTDLRDRFGAAEAN